MLLRLLTSLSGPLFNLAPGDEYDFDDAEAGRLIDAGFAEQASAPAKKRKKGDSDVVSSEGDAGGDNGAGSA